MLKNLNNFLKNWVRRISDPLHGGPRNLEGKEGHVLLRSAGVYHRSHSRQGVRIYFHLRNSNPLQCSCLENSMDGGAWWAAVHGVTKSRTQFSDWGTSWTIKYKMFSVAILNTTGLTSSNLLKCVLSCPLNRWVNWDIEQLNILPKFSSIPFSHSVMSDSLLPHGLQHARLPCPKVPRVSVLVRFRFRRSGVESTFLTDSQVMLVLLACGPHFGVVLCWSISVNNL